MLSLLPERARLRLFCLSLLLFAAADANAIVVDNFEDGAFSLLATPGASDAGTQVLTVPTNGISSPREVTLTSFGDVCSADLSVSPAVNDEIQMVIGEGGGQLDLFYVPEQADLTGGGLFDGLEVDLTVAVAAGVVRVELSDTAGNTQAVGRTIGGPGSLVFPYTDFTPVNMEEIRTIRVILDTNTQGDYHLTDIRATEAPNPDAAADYVIENLLEGDTSRVTLWSHAEPVDGSHVLRTVDPRVPDTPMPYESNWVFMIDDAPGANWAHPVRWVVVRADLGEHTIYEQDWIPAIVSEQGEGPQVEFGCIGATQVECPTLGPLIPQDVPDFTPGLGDDCLYAVLISGGWNDSSNYSRYAENLTSMYQRLLAIGYKKSNIWTFYADGSLPLDMDDADGDDNHFTGNDVDGGATEAAVRSRIQFLCQNLNADRDVLFIYTSNHGVSNGSLMLWDFNDNGMWEDNEFLSPSELSSDTENCQVCRNFMILDQCYAGAFTSIANDGNHPNTAIYAAATASEVSWGREYLDWWEDLDQANLEMNELHQSVVNSGTMNSTPVFSQTQPGTGNVPLNYCWGEDVLNVPSSVGYCGLEGTIDVKIAICNQLPSAQTYDLSFEGLPASIGCDVPGPSLFLVDDPNPVVVQAGECKTVTVTIGRPDNQGLLNWTACYQVTLTNTQLGFTRTARAKVYGSQIPILCMEIPAEQHVWLNPLDLVTVDFLVRNPGDDTLFTYEFDAVASDGLAENNAISLDDLAPGESVRGSVFVPAGGEQLLSVDVMLTDESSDIFYDLQLQGTNPEASRVEVVGERRIGEVLASVGLRQAAQVATSLDPTPRLGPVQVELIPNPFNPRTEIRFRTVQAGESAVIVLDARGRRIQTLHEGVLPNGEHRFEWNGLDRSGQRVASGTYFVHVRTSEGISVRKATLIK